MITPGDSDASKNTLKVLTGLQPIEHPTTGVLALRIPPGKSRESGLDLHSWGRPVCELQEPWWPRAALLALSTWIHTEHCRTLEMVTTRIDA